MVTTVENRFKPEAAHFPFVSDQAQTVPWGEGYAGTLPGTPSPILLRRVGRSKTNSARRIGGGYKALKFRFLLFL
jgi:hypothetical protein